MPDLTARAREIVRTLDAVPSEGILAYVEEALSSVREEALREAAEVAHAHAAEARATMDESRRKAGCDDVPDILFHWEEASEAIATAILALRDGK